MSDAMRVHFEEVSGNFQADISLLIWRLYQRIGMIHSVCQKNGFVFKKDIPVDEYSAASFETKDGIQGLYVRSSEYSQIFMIRRKAMTIEIRAYDVYQELNEEERGDYSEYERIKYSYADDVWAEFPARPAVEYFVDRYSWGNYHNCTPILDCHSNAPTFCHKVLEWEHGKSIPKELNSVLSSNPPFNISHVSIPGLKTAIIYLENALSSLISEDYIGRQDLAFAPKDLIHESFYYFDQIFESELDPILKSLCNSKGKQPDWIDGNLYSESVGGYSLDKRLNKKTKPGLSETGALMAILNGLDDDAIVFNLPEEVSPEWIAYGIRSFIELKAYLSTLAEDGDHRDILKNMPMVEKAINILQERA